MADVNDPILIPGIALAIDERAVRVASERPLAVLSSAVVGAELRATRHIVNMHVVKGYHCANPEDDLTAFAAQCGITELFVGMMTAAWTQNARVAIETHADISVAAIVTAGLGNAMNVGVSPPRALSAGTINIILLIDAALTQAAQANAIITATEAKTMTLIERDARTRDGDRASGTSTDSVVVACTNRGEPMRYAGSATVVGWLIGRAVRRALGWMPGK
ncbi:MAG: adenosylcobinamide amidohydrolase [Chloroflexi bacterium]|nr:adenosylcobinamide amidohydrolase [Chloroflexota bacterium]